MTKWLHKISFDPMDFQAVLDAYTYFEDQYEYFRKELDIKGKNINQVAAKIPGLSEYHYAQMSEVRAIFDNIELEYESVKQKARKFYLENYNRTMTAGQVENYADNNQDVIEMKRIMVQMKFMLNLWEGLSRGIERLHHQVRIISDNRRGGLDDATI